MRLLEFLILAVPGCFLTASCVKEIPHAESAVAGLRELTITVNASKLTLEEGDGICWTEGDQISVFNGSDVSDSQNSAGGYLFAADSSGSCVTFTGQVPDGIEDLTGWVAYYRYNAKNTYDGTTLTGNVPNEYGDNRKVYPRLVGIFSGKSVTMKHLGSLLEFDLSASGISSVRLRGNNDEYLAGWPTITFDKDGNPVEGNDAPDAAFAQYGSIVFRKDKGLDAGTYYFPVPPANFRNGITLTFQKKSDPSMYAELRGESALDIPRATIKSLGTVDSDLEWFKGVQFSCIDFPTKGARNPLWPFVEKPELSQSEADIKTFTTIEEGLEFHVLARGFCQNTQSGGQGVKIGGRAGDFLEFPVISGYGLKKIVLWSGKNANDTKRCEYCLKCGDDVIGDNWINSTRGAHHSWEIDCPCEAACRFEILNEGDNLTIQRLYLYYAKLTEEDEYNITGVVSCDGVPLANVVVSDGEKFAETNSNGRYRLQSSKSQQTVFVITPSGYSAVSKDKLQPAFWAPLKKDVNTRETVDFELVQEDQSSYSAAFIADLHLCSVDKRGDLKAFEEDVIPLFRKIRSKYSASGPVYTINLGDLSFEKFWFDSSQRGAAGDFTLEDVYDKLKSGAVPGLMYSVIGNHDHDASRRGENPEETEFVCAHLYRKLFGPAWYSVNIGRDHWVFLNSINYVNTSVSNPAPGLVGKRDYTEEFSTLSMEWLKNDLARVPAGTGVYICTHCPPLFNKKDYANLEMVRSSVQQLDDILAQWGGTAQIFAGHRHEMDYCEDMEFPHLKVHSFAATSGDCWQTEAKCGENFSFDGTPQGVSVGTFSNGKYDLTFETVRYGEKYLKSYDEGNAILVNCWMMNDGDILELRENGTSRTLTRVFEQDPSVKGSAFFTTSKSGDEPPYTRHMFRADVSSSSSSVEIKLRNAAGQEKDRDVLRGGTNKVQAHAKGESGWTEYDARSPYSIAGFRPAEDPTTDVYGGWKGSASGMATGYFRVGKANGRWWFFTPEGNPFLSRGVAVFKTGKSERQKAAVDSRFGTYDDWAENQMGMLRKYGFNSLGAWSEVDIVRKSDNRMPYTVILTPMKNCINYLKNHYLEPDADWNNWWGYPNGCMMVWDENFDRYVEGEAAKAANYASDPWCIGYFIDNELPLRKTALENCLKKWPATHITNIKAQEWLDARKGHRASTSEITEADRNDFIAYMYGVYLEKVSTALRKYDPNHLFLGTKFDEWEHELVNPAIWKEAGKWCDVLSIDYYQYWQPSVETLAQWESWSGRPCLIAEFYVKGEDACTPESGLTNEDGAGWTVKTQRQRGFFYQNFVNELLKSPNCVGWHWFTYMDNDPQDTTVSSSNKNSNKGIVRWDCSEYTDALDEMRVTNKCTYNLASFYCNK